MTEQPSAPHELTAPPSWRRVDFISDLHLSEATPRAFEAWREYLLNTAADAVFILGDLFEAWVGDDSRFDGSEARGTAVLRQAAAQRALFFMIGNRDFLLGHEMLADCGVQGLPDPTVLAAFGTRALLTHGDAWCTDDRPYQQFRTQVRNPAWQAQVLSRPLAERRAMARNLRSESERLSAEGQGVFVDVDTPTAVRWMTATSTTTLVHGHTHRPRSEPLAPCLERHVLSDWDLDHSPGAARAEVLRWSAAGWARLQPRDASRAHG